MRLLTTIALLAAALANGTATVTTVGAQSSEEQAQITESKPLETEEAYRRVELLIGTWYGDAKTFDGGRRQWIVSRTADGKSSVRFRSHDSMGGVTESVENRYWGVVGDLYFTITTGGIVDGEEVSVPPLDPYNCDAYRILKLTESVFEYEQIVTHNHFTVSRVADNSDFPP